MYSVEKSEEFDLWLSEQRDLKAVAKILLRIKQVELGNFGDWKFIGDKIYELRLDWGKGYRIYYTKRNLVVVLLLYGGDKGSQDRDIKTAKKILNEMG